MTTETADSAFDNFDYSYDAMLPWALFIVGKLSGLMALTSIYVAPDAVTTGLIGVYAVTIFSSAFLGIRRWKAELAEEENE
jgi:hypothetical protein|tara:strand:- start:141 stop:383 length:243 start_codon:yes stop_codon:yes gene_type:complete